MFWLVRVFWFFGLFRFFVFVFCFFFFLFHTLQLSPYYKTFPDRSMDMPIYEGDGWVNKGYQMK